MPRKFVTHGIMFIVLILFITNWSLTYLQNVSQMRYKCENGEVVKMHILREWEVDTMCQCYGKS